MRAGGRFGSYFAVCAALASAGVPQLAQTQAQQQPPSTQLAPFAAPGSTQLAPSWHFEGFPDSYAKPETRFDIALDHGEPVLRVTTDDSYGTLAQNWQGPAPAALQWHWRLDRPLAQTDIATRSGDDSALKVCVMFDEPLAQIPLLDRTALRIARATFGRPLPAATLCYLWDSRYPAGSTGHNAFTSRMRYIVLRGPQAPLGRWLDEQRNVADDFQKLFGDESPRTPRVIAVAVGADSDNTHGASVGWIAALRWAP